MKPLLARKAIGRKLEDRESLEAHLHQAARWTYIGSGMVHERFQETLNALSRRAAEATADFLQTKGIRAAAYHAGMTAEQRASAQDRFSRDELDVVCATRLAAEKGSRSSAHTDYYDRSGFPKGLQAARGAARSFEVPRDFRTPDALRPRGQQQESREAAAATAPAASI